MPKNLYVAQYWQKDREKLQNFDYGDTLAFYAENDGQAQRLALDYIRLNNTWNLFDMGLSRLVRLSFETQEVPVKNDGNTLTCEQREDAMKKLERRLERATFVKLKDAIVPPKK